MPVEIPVVVFRKPAGVRHFSRQQTGRQGHAGENPYFAFLRLGKKEFRRALAEKVEDNLHRLNVRILNGFEGFLDFFHTDAIVPELSRFHQVVENSKHLRSIINFSGRAMQLQQVNRFRMQILEATIDEGGEVLAAVTFGRLRRQAASGFRGDVKLFPPLLFQSGQQPFTAAIAINIGGVEEVHTTVQCCVERGE